MPSRSTWIAVEEDTLLAKGLELLSADGLLMQAELDVQKGDGGRDDTIPEKAGEGADGTVTVIDIVAVDLLRLDDRRGKFVVEFVLIIYDLAVIHGQPPLCAVLCN